MKAQRILMAADAMGGVWTYALQLMRALPDVEFAFCTMGPPPSKAQRNELRLLDNVNPFVSSYKLEWMDAPWAEVDAAGDWLLEVATDFQPDVIHLNGYSHAFLPWDVPVMVVAHSCVVSWWRAVKQQQPPPEFDEYRERVTRGLAAADMVIAPSQWMLSSLRDNYNAHVQGAVIHNGCGPPPRPRPKRHVIVAAGRLWDEAKNLRALDAVAPHIPWPIEIAGDAVGPSGSGIQLRSAHHLGSLPSAQLSRAMANAAIFALPARYEPFGLSALEAAANQCALVLGDIPTLRELWGTNALFVEAEDTAELARALNRLVADEPLRRDFAGRALRRAGQFTAEIMAERYRTAYVACLGRKSADLAA